jgi:hypothetical protein
VNQRTEDRPELADACAFSSRISLSSLEAIIEGDHVLEIVMLCPHCRPEILRSSPPSTIWPHLAADLAGNLN